MNTWSKRTMLLFVCIVVLKLSILPFVNNPTALADEYIYFKTAENIWENQEYSLQGSKYIQYPPIYSFVISPAFTIEDRFWQYKTIQIFNVFISSSVVLLVFWITKRIFSSERNAFFASILTGFLPSTFSLFPYIMSENLFLPLFFLSIYLIWKSFEREKYFINLLAGIITGLAILTRVIGTIILLATAVFAIYKLITSSDKLSIIKGKLLFFISVSFFIGVWIFRQWVTTDTLLGGYTYLEQSFFSQYRIFSFMAWLFLYLGAVVLSSGILFTITSMNNKHPFTFFSMCIIIVFITIAAYHSANYPYRGSILLGRPLLRYLDVVIPLLFIVGMQAKERIKGNYLAWSILAIPILGLFSLFPFNNPNLSILGVISLLSGQGILTISILFVLMVALLTVKKYLRFSFILLFLVFSSIVATTSIVYNSEILWEENIQIKISALFYDYPETTIILDKEYESRIDKAEISLYEQINPEFFMSLIDMKTNKKIQISDANNLSGKTGLFITKKELQKQIIYAVDEYYIYKL